MLNEISIVVRTTSAQVIEVISVHSVRVTHTDVKLSLTPAPTLSLFQRSRPPRQQ